MHIGKFYHPHPGGIETFMRDLLVALADDSVQTLALVHAHRRADELGCSGRELDGDVQVRRVPCFGSVLYAPVSPSFLSWLDNAIDDFKPDLLHLHLPNTSAFWALASGRARSIPWVVHWHADVITPVTQRKLGLAYRIYQPLEHAILRGARAIVATSPPYLANSTPLQAVKDRCQVIPLGLNTTRFSPGLAEVSAWAGRTWGNASLRVFALGRLAHYKGFQHLIEATAHLGDVQVLIAGKGEEQDFLQREILRHGVANKVRLLGYVDDDHAHALMATCDVFCLPSVEKTEAFGMVLLEAMAFSRPIVASRLDDSGVGWVVQDGITGLLAQPGSAADLAEKILAAANRPELGIAGRRRLDVEFAIDRVAKQMASAYQGVLDAPKM